MNKQDETVTITNINYEGKDSLPRVESTNMSWSDTSSKLDGEYFYGLKGMRWDSKGDKVRLTLFIYLEDVHKIKAGKSLTIKFSEQMEEITFTLNKFIKSRFVMVEGCDDPLFTRMVFEGTISY